MKIKSLLLPAPLEVLINEYDKEFIIEARDVMCAIKGRNRCMDILKNYTKTLNNSTKLSSQLYITDRYLFSVNSSDYLKEILEILIDINIKK